MRLVGKNQPSLIYENGCTGETLPLKYGNLKICKCDMYFSPRIGLAFYKKILSEHKWYHKVTFLLEILSALESLKKQSILRTYSLPKPPLPPCTQPYAI